MPVFGTASKAALAKCHAHLQAVASRVTGWCIPDVRSVLSKAWSLRLIELAALTDIIINVVPYLSDYLPWWLTAALLVGAWAARLLHQGDANANQ